MKYFYLSIAVLQLLLMSVSAYSQGAGGNLRIMQSQNSHMHIVEEAYELLVSEVGSIPEMNDHITGQIGTGALLPLSYGGNITNGAFREDEEDIVYGYGSNFYDPNTTVTHFWDVDAGDNFQHSMGTYPSVQNLYMKARALVFGGYSFLWPGQQPGTTDRFSGPSYLPHFLDPQITQLHREGYYNSLGQWYATDDWVTVTETEKHRITWEILGRIAHLLADALTPAHAHCDAHPCVSPLQCDYYELYCSTWYYIWDASDAASQGGVIEVVGKQDPFRYLFYSCTQLADYFPSSDYNGDLVYQPNDPLSNYPEAWEQVQLDGGVPRTKLQIVNDQQASQQANILMPFSIRATAGLLKWFAYEAGMLDKVFVQNRYMNDILSQQWTSYGSIVVDDNNIVSSGDEVWLPVGVHSYRPAEYRETNAVQGVDHKFTSWINDPEGYHYIYESNDYTDKLAIHEVPVEAMAFVDNVHGLTHEMTFRIKDPWWITGSGNNWLQENQYQWLTTESQQYNFMTDTGPEGEQYGGLFLNKQTSVGLPHYAIQLPVALDPIGQIRPGWIQEPIQSGDNVIVGISDNGKLTFDYPDISAHRYIGGYVTNPVVVNGVNGEFTAIYKPHLHSYHSIPYANNECPTCPTSQRKLLVDGSGIHHLIYESNGGIWYTNDSDIRGGVKYWMPEIRINNWNENSKYPSASMDGNAIYVVWNNNGSIRLSCCTDLVNVNWMQPITVYSDAREDAHPVISYNYEDDTFVLAYEKTAAIAIAIWGDLSEAYREVEPGWSPSYPSITKYVSISHYMETHYSIVWSDNWQLYVAKVIDANGGALVDYKYEPPTPAPVFAPVDSYVSNTSTEMVYPMNIEYIASTTMMYGQKMSQVIRRYDDGNWGMVDVFAGTSGTDQWSPMISTCKPRDVRMVANEGQSGFIIQKYSENTQSWSKEYQHPSSGSGADIMASVIEKASVTEQLMVVPYASPLYSNTTAIDPVVDGLPKRNKDMDMAYVLLAAKDKDTSITRINPLILKRGSVENTLKWRDKVDSLQLTSKLNISKHMESDVCEIQQGDNIIISYEEEQISGVIRPSIYVHIRNSVNDSVLGIVGPLLPAVSQSGKRTATVNMTLYSNLTVYLVADVFNYDSTVNYRLSRLWYEDSLPAPINKSMYDKVSEKEKAEQEGLEVVVYPNPANSILTIEVDVTQLNDTYDVFIYDAEGNIVYSKKEDIRRTDKHYIPLNVSNIKPGAYVIAIRGKVASGTTKVIIN